MIEDLTFEKSKVYLNDLSEKMTILAYIGFTKKYQRLSHQTCAFLKHNFVGASALVGRDGKRYTLSIENIQEQDHLFKICNFPPTLCQLTEVSDRLIRSLRTQGMLRFEVIKPATLTLDNHRDLVYLIDLVKSQPSLGI